jgi:flagella basal body P-ring formation protein FlgA
MSREEWNALLGRRLREFGLIEDWSILDTSRNPVPAGSIEFAPSGLSRIGQDRYLWRGRVHGAAAPGFSVWVRFEARPKRPALVSREDLQVGMPLNKESFVVEYRPGHLTDGPPLDPGLIPNGVLRRSVRRGEEIRVGDIAMPILVKQGQRTQVTVSGSGAHLAFEANALQSGQLGQFVLLENPINRRRFRAEVIAPAAVAVHAGRKERD